MLTVFTQQTQLVLLGGLKLFRCGWLEWMSFCVETHDELVLKRSYS